MNVHNLAIVFGPTLFQTTGQNYKPGRVVEDLINHYLAIFHVDPQELEKRLKITSAMMNMQQISYPPSTGTTKDFICHVYLGEKNPEMQQIVHIPVTMTAQELTETLLERRNIRAKDREYWSCFEVDESEGLERPLHFSENVLPIFHSEKTSKSHVVVKKNLHMEAMLHYISEYHTPTHPMLHYISEHRSLGPSISKVRSLKMDDKVWTEEMIELFLELGNAASNRFWAANVPPSEAISASSGTLERKTFIMAKYREGKYRRYHQLFGNQTELNKALCAAVTTNDLSETQALVFCGADVNCSSGDLLYPQPIDLAEQAGQRLQMEFLQQNKTSEIPRLELGNDGVKHYVMRPSVTHNGFLYKTSSMTKPVTERKNREDFSKRWCILNDNQLSYYENNHSSSPNGEIKMEEIVCVAIIPPDTHGFERCFEIYTKSERLYLFAAETAKDARDWVTSITKNMSRSLSQPSMYKQNMSLSLSQPSMYKLNMSLSLSQPSMYKQNMSHSLSQPSMYKQNMSLSLSQPSMYKPNMSLSLSQPSMYKQNMSLSLSQPSMYKQNMSLSLSQPSMYKQNMSRSLSQPSMYKQNMSHSLSQPSMYKQNMSLSLSQPSMYKQNMSRSLSQPSMYKQNM
ncbi:arf-GAP with Rho-GAP domain, ANK repeat and PH domain-containing 1 isoform X4 [Pelobates cultripes]|nr:arf-GAP with Rho-GAP domain, ANK repeat and PH domain-containing 1 isoform X4 [Pelobates cultripes]